jgi:transcriptional regulator with GAF, ATPase, and Fis domain
VQRPIERPVCEGELRRNSRRFAGKRAVRSRAWRLHRGGRAQYWTVRAGHRGTLFLDEIGDLPLELQPKILRVMQERQFERLGGAATIHTDVRVICATHRNLAEMVEEREFRADLFYRLSVFPIELPPLRERPEDIRLLVHHFAMDYAAACGSRYGISEEFMAALARHSWPGNVRELQNFIERSVILSKGLC